MSRRWRESCPEGREHLEKNRESSVVAIRYSGSGEIVKRSSTRSARAVAGCVIPGLHWFLPDCPQGSPQLHRMCTELPPSALAGRLCRVQSGIRACDESVHGSLPCLRWYWMEVWRGRPAGEPVRVPSEAEK